MFTRYTSASILGCMAVLLSACSSQPEISNTPQALDGSCDYDRRELLAKLPALAIEVNGETELEGANGEYFSVPAERLKAFPKARYFQLDISTRIGGNCQPTVLHSIAPLSIDNLDITPNDGRLYQSSSVLKAVKACLGEYSISFCQENGLTEALDLDQASLLRQSQPRLLRQCSVDTLTALQSKLVTNSSDAGYLICSPGLDSDEIAIQIKASAGASGKVFRAFEPR
ncbi:hypothetical protein [Aliamphritea ceti]|uniref:hypothetical protein n=1 Tax=Aliamphritea ceti TaxID=1524258 RepID=UPI0021C40F89|nr:hypothetical protein [Aliamphritea ceti]